MAGHNKNGVRLLLPHYLTVRPAATLKAMKAMKANATQLYIKFQEQLEYHGSICVGNPEHVQPFKSVNSYTITAVCFHVSHLTFSLPLAVVFHYTNLTPYAIAQAPFSENTQAASFFSCPAISSSAHKKAVEAYPEYGYVVDVMINAVENLALSTPCISLESNHPHSQFLTIQGCDRLPASHIHLPSPRRAQLHLHHCLALTHALLHSCRPLTQRTIPRRHRLC